MTNAAAPSGGAKKWTGTSDEDAFVTALRDIDGARELPRHCKGHLHRMRTHGFVELVERFGVRAWVLTAEGRARAFPQYGTLRVSTARLRAAIGDSGNFLHTSAVLHKTQAARDSLRASWYTPGYAKTVVRTKY